MGAKDVVPIQVQEGKDPWIIGTIPNTKTGIVSIPSFGGNIDEQTQARNQFIDTFFSQKEKNKWQNIIFDFRGNTGGDSEIIKEIAERMGNTSVKYADKSLGLFKSYEFIPAIANISPFVGSIMTTPRFSGV